jgi:hypothetical protein
MVIEKRVSQVILPFTWCFKEFLSMITLANSTLI